MSRWLIVACIAICGALSLLLSATAMAHSPAGDLPPRAVARPRDQLRQAPPPSPPPVSATATVEPISAGCEPGDSRSCADPEVEMSGNGPISPKSTATFAMTVTNLGAGPSHDSSLVVDLPAGVLWTSLIGPSGACSMSGAPGSQKIACDFGDLAPGAAQTLTISGGVDEADCPGIQATATVSASNEPASAAANNEAEAEIQVTCPTDVAVTAEPLDPTVDAGDTAGFAFTLANLGPGDAVGATLTANLPAGATWTSWTEPDVLPNEAGTCALAGAPGSQTLSCDLGDLAPAATRMVTVRGRTAATSCGEQTAAVSIVAANEADDVLANDTAGASLIVGCANVSVEAAANATNVDAGDAAAVAFTLRNTGDAPATGVMLTNQLPAGLAWTLLPAVAGCAVDQNALLTCSGLEIPAGGEIAVNAAAPTSPTDCGTASNGAATVQAAIDVDPANNTAGPVSLAIGCPQVTVGLTAASAAISAKDTAQFSVLVGNAGAGAAHAVNLSNTLPAGVEWQIGGPDAATCSLDGGVLTCDFGDLPANEIRTVTLSAETSPANCGDLADAVTVAAANEPAGDTADNSASASITVSCPDLAVAQQAAAASISAGDPAEFTITLSNLGQGAARSAGLSDPLPPGVDWRVSGPDAAGCAIADTSLTCEFGDLGPSETRTVTLSAATSAAACGDLTSNITATDSNEIIGEGGTQIDLRILANNMATSTVTVLCPDIAVTATPDAPSVAAGSSLGVTLAVANAGPGDAAAVTISAPLPSESGLDWAIESTTPASDACTIAAGTLACDIGPLAANASASVHITSPVPPDGDCGTIETQAMATAANERPADQANNTGSGGVLLECPAIQITIEPTDGHGESIAQAPAGASVVYSYVVTNTGNVPLTNVSARDDNATPDDPKDDMAVTGCFVASLEPAATVSCTLVHVVTGAGSATATELQNVATAGGAPPHGDAVTASASASLTVNPRAAIGLRTECPAAVTAGQILAVSVFLSNNGAVAVTDLIVTDSLAGPLPYAIGDTDSDRQLDPDETWSFSGFIIVPTDENSLSRTVSATGTDLNGNPVSVATAPCTTAVQPPVARAP